LRIFPNHKTRLFDAFNWQNFSQHAPYGQQRLEQALEEAISQAYYNQLVQEQRAAALAAVRKALADNHLDALLSSMPSPRLVACSRWLAFRLRVCLPESAQVASQQAWS
jgi:hypothetical protein